MATPVCDLQGGVKVYDSDPPTRVLEDVSLEVHPGERVVIVGRSGAGKSTLLNALGLLDALDAGSYSLFGTETSELAEQDRNRLLATRVGFIFQEFHVLGHRTVAENLDLRLAISGVPRRQRGPLIKAALDQVDLGHRADHLSRLLSGGEKQRLAVARAFVSEPGLVLADEPTGNLDGENTQRILGLLDERAKSGAAVIVITHDDRTSAWADRALELKHGQLQDSTP